MSFTTVKIFENVLADWWGAPYAVATDCCTHAIELCLRMTQANDIIIPRHTYISVPMTAQKLGIDWYFTHTEWEKFYTIGNTNIIDSAVHWEPQGYLKGSLQCLSFQFKKPLNLGRGGAILCNTLSEYNTLKAMSYDGRLGDAPWSTQDITTYGYHYYMTPETAQLGIERLPHSLARHTHDWNWSDYPDLMEFEVFQDK